MEHFCHGTNGGWKKLPENPLLGGELGTCFDIAMLRENDEILLYFSWRDKASIALCKSRDGIHWDEPRFCIRPRKAKEGREDDLNRPSGGKSRFDLSYVVHRSVQAWSSGWHLRYFPRCQQRMESILSAQATNRYCGRSFHGKSRR